MIELKIDGASVDMDQKAEIAITLGIADIEDPGSSSTGFSKTLELPMTPRNMKIFNYTGEIFSREQYNNELHTAVLYAHGMTVMTGIAQMEKFVRREGAEGMFHVSIIGAAYDWITNAQKTMEELSGGDGVNYNFDAVYKNSIETKPTAVKFFPVDRGAFVKEDGTTPRSTLHLLDYHPFINIWKTLELIFKGYTIRSSCKEFLSTLYCAGQMPESEHLSEIEENNDFYIGTILEDEMELTLTPSIRSRSLSIYKRDSGEDFHNKNGVIRKFTNASTGKQSVVFTPKDDMTVRFEVGIHCQTQIENMHAFDASCRYLDQFTFHIGSQKQVMHLSLDQTTNITDKITKKDLNGKVLIEGRKESTTDTYVVCLEFPSGFQAQDIWAVHLNSKGQDEYTYSMGPAKGGKNWYVVKAKDKKKDLHFWAFGTNTLFGSSNINDYTLDISAYVRDFMYYPIYDGQVGFQLTKFTDAFQLEKGKSYELLAEFGISMRLNEEFKFSVMPANTLKPDFGNFIGANTIVRAGTVGGQGTQIDFLSSVRQLFNLMFYTNPVTREVFIEPRSSFYNLDRKDLVDWSDKIDYSKQIEVEELGGDIGKVLKLGYADGNDVVAKYNWKRHTELGACTIQLLNKNTDDTCEIINDTYAPFLTHSVPSMGMNVLQNVPEGEDPEVIDSADLEITPVVGQFAGVQERTITSDNPNYSLYNQYPRLIFQDLGKRINLSFANIYAAPGLRRFYQSNIAVYNYGRRITAYLDLHPQDVEPILLPNRLKRDFRAVYLLRIEGEEVPCLLETISDYNPAAGSSTQCTFIYDPNLQLTGEDPAIITYGGEVILRGSYGLKFKN